MPLNPFQLPVWFLALHEWMGFDLTNPWLQIALLFAWGVTLFTMVVVVGKAAVVFMVLMERKVLAWLTQRKGPNRVGPFGLLQTIADGVKLLFKEDVMNPQQDKFLFTLGPAIFIFPVFVMLAMVPFTDVMIGLALPVGALLVFALSSISVIGMVMAGWASNNKYSLLGGIRSAAQAISYEIPLVMAVLAVVLFAGSMNLVEIVEAQRGPLGPLSWYWFYITPLAFVIFLISSIAEVNRIPFDLPEAESELVSGYNTEYSGMKFAMFFLAEYAALFVMCALTVTFFFGGYNCLLAGVTMPWGVTIDTTYINTPLIPVEGVLVPLGTWLQNLTGFDGLAGLLDQLEKISWMVLKIYVFIFFAMWLRGTLPRLKPDQLMGFSWKFLIPLSLVNLFAVGIQRFWAHPTQDIAALIAGVIENPAFLVSWLVVLVGGVGGFCWWMSKQLNEKIRSRYTA
jgi:NADH-quinone oxidoreductase subunit H